MKLIKGAWLQDRGRSDKAGAFGAALLREAGHSLTFLARLARHVQVRVSEQDGPAREPRVVSLESAKMLLGQDGTKGAKRHLPV